MGIRLALLTRAWRRRLDAAFAEIGLTDATWAPMIHLAEHGDGISQKTLAARVGVDPSTLVRLMDILNDRGLITRETDLDDRRARRVYLTPAGRALLAQMDVARAAIEADILADFSDRDVARLGDMVGKLERRLEQA